MLLKQCKAMSLGLLVVSMGVLMPVQAADLTPGVWERMVQQKKLTAEQSTQLKRALSNAHFASQGGEAAAKHPMTREQCLAQALPKLKGGAEDESECGHPWMAAVPSADGKTKVCIDRFEYPNLPCEYPVTWVQAKDAAAICEAEGKRLCDAHEWESSCSGSPQPSDYAQSREAHNASRKKVWAYGNARRGDICGFGQSKSPGCDAAIVSNVNVKGACGANDWPAGSFPECVSPTGVYDQHGNVAEHMNLARKASEAGANGGHGVTEMKGSWFVFSRTSDKGPHEDDCLWRAPGWHRTDVLSAGSHANYHLGFRCCSDVSGSVKSSGVGQDVLWKAKSNK